MDYKIWSCYEESLPSSVHFGVQFTDKVVRRIKPERNTSVSMAVSEEEISKIHNLNTNVGYSILLRSVEFCRSL